MVKYMKDEIRLAQVTGETNELLEKLGEIPNIADKLENGKNVFEDEMVPAFHELLHSLTDDKEKSSTYSV